MYVIRFKKDNLFNLVIFVCLLLVSYVVWNNRNDDISFVVLTGTYMSLSLLAYQVLFLINRHIPYYDFRIWFVLLSYLFMFGRFYTNSLGYDEIFYSWGKYYTNEVVLQTVLFTLCYLQAFFLGICWKNQTLTRVVSLPQSRSTFEIGIILFLMSGPFRLYEDVRAIKLVQATGEYSSLVASSGIAHNLALFFIPAVVYILLGRVLSKKNTQILVTCTVVYLILCMILTGDRRYQVIGIIVICVCYTFVNDIKIVSFRNVVGYGFVVVLLSILYQLRKLRTGNLNGTWSFISSFNESLGSYNIFYETLNEFGISFYSVAGIVKNIPSQLPYQKGLGFYGAIPSLLPIGYIDKVRTFFRSVSISNFINSYEGRPVGATLVGDFYANFGWLSLLFVPLTAYLFMQIMFVLEDDECQSIANYYSLFYIFLNVIRCSFYEIVRPTVYIVIVPLVISRLLYRKEKL